MAGWATDWILAFRRTTSFASATRILTRNFNFGLEPKGSFPERNLQVIAEIGAPLRTAAAPSAENIAETEEFAEDVAEVSKSCRIESAETALQPAVAIAVIAGPFVGVAQYAIGLGGFLKLLFGAFVVLVFVGMVLESQFAIGALDFLIRGILVNPKDFVIVAFIIQRKSPLSINS